MPRRNDLNSIVVIGSGPIVIGQACEFDYSGTQAAKVLKSHGYRVVLINSNPATIMTDPEFADATYIEPITPGVVRRILETERPDALLPTLGGQTALNVTRSLALDGTLREFGVELIGAGLDAIERAEDRARFSETMQTAGIETPRGATATTVVGASRIAADVGFPVIVRPSFALGGGGAGVATDRASLAEVARLALETSPIGEILIEESVLGWKEFELEVMRDGADNAVIVCSIENLDPMGIHTGDSITVAPVQTLSDREYQEMRTEAIECLRAIGVSTGGSNVQFAVDPQTGRRLIIEMNPRVSRSSALASKATGFPIAKIAALLAIGFRLDELPNDITGATPASFEPALDYVVVKAPRFDFSKFPATPGHLGMSMQSVGEAMAIGRTFAEALQKALRSLETGRSGLGADDEEQELMQAAEADLMSRLSQVGPERIFAVAEALRRGIGTPTIAEVSGIDRWFVEEISAVVAMRQQLEGDVAPSAAVLRQAKRLGFSDGQISHLTGRTESEVRRLRLDAGVVRTYKTVDTCAAEFEAETPYFYGTFEDEDEVPKPTKPRVVILGSGPNRIGQGVEFDYCCVHAAFALRDAGYETIMVNCNPETVSTDYDTSDRLYFEPLTSEDVLAVINKERPDAVLVQLGGQTPLNLAVALSEAGVPIAGTPPEAIARAEDRAQFAQLCRELGVAQPAHGTATTPEQAVAVADRVGLPLLARPSFVLGGRSMQVAYTREELTNHLDDLIRRGWVSESAPLLLDRFLEGATEVDLDAVFDGDELYVGGILEHVQEAGVHSGDSACVVPPPTISEEAQSEMVAIAEALARELGVIGLINLQFAVKGDEVFVLEANPRASRTVPFVSKATGVPLAKLAARVMLGSSLDELRLNGWIQGASTNFVAVKEAVLPWDRFPAEDVVLGPEMKATGEVMGIGADFDTAFAKALVASGQQIPLSGRLFISLADRDKARGLAAAQAFWMLGFELCATEGTAKYLKHHGVDTERVDKIGEGRSDPIRLLTGGHLDLVVNTPRGRRARGDGALIRKAARRHGIPCITTIEGALAVAGGIRAGSVNAQPVRSIQDWHA